MNPRAAACLLSCMLNGAATACQADSPPAAEPSVRDSAGVRIVEYAATPEPASPFVFSSLPLYSYGAGLEDYAFQRIWRGVLLPDGSATVADAANREVVSIGPDGIFGGRLAGPGDGPGEINMVAGLLPAGRDSLLVHDFGHARLTLFAGGEPVREVDTRLLNRGLSVRGLDAGGQALMTSASYRSGFREPWLQGYMVRFDMGTGAVDTVASYDWLPSSPREGPENPFGPLGLVTVARGRFVYLRSDRPEVIWRNSDGTPHQIVRWRSAPTYPDDEDWRLYEASLRAQLRLANPHIQSDEEFEEFASRVLAGREMAPNEPLPLVGELFADREGRVWLGDWAADAPLLGTTRYSVLAPDGGWLGDVHVPPRVRILDVAGRRVLGVARDELGVESVVVYELLSAEPEEGFQAAVTGRRGPGRAVRRRVPRRRRRRDRGAQAP